MTTFPATGMSMTVDNVSSKLCDDWSAGGLPVRWDDINLIGTKNGVEHFVYLRNQELHARISPMLPGERMTLQLRHATPEDNVPLDFKLAPWVTDEIAKLIPQFRLLRGTEVLNSLPIAIVSTDVRAMPANMRIHFITRFVGVPIIIEGWVTIANGQEVINWTIIAGYGTNELEQDLEAGPCILSMLTGEPTHVDDRTLKGLHEPVLRVDLGDKPLWETELANSSVSWHRGRNVRVRGAFLCQPKDEVDPSDPRMLGMQYRADGKPRLTFDQWDGEWGATGTIPTLLPDDVDQERVRFDIIAGNRANDVGSEDDQRRYNAPQYTGTTGEQACFGMSYRLPEGHERHYLEHDLDGSFRRPLINREVDASVVQAALNPDTVTYNLKPDQRFTGASKMLGWPVPAEWLNGWGGIDGQHRSEDTFITAMFRLERCPAVERMLRAWHQLDIMDHRERAAPEPNLGQVGGYGSPRELGRVLLAWCNAYRCGFTEVEPLIRNMVRRVARAACYREFPDGEIQVSSRNEWKYGWLRPDGSAPRGWLPWQESILVMGMYAAWKVLAIDEAVEHCMRVAPTLTRHGYYNWDGGILSCYAVRWNDGPDALELTSYTPDQPNYDVYTYNMSKWTNPALKILVELDPNHTDAPRAREILAHFGVAHDWVAAQWAAV